jgi:2',3'-cyclic-nucleotide 2'-phosphodiesterase (5'-nucleotidase family)
MVAITRRLLTASFAATGIDALFGRGARAAATANVTLVLTNDIYKMGEDKGRGGFARLAGIVAAERARSSNVLFFHAGDCLSPSLMSGFDQGAHIIELLNIAKPDVFVPGNHEFDFGGPTYLKRMGEANFPIFAANLRGPDNAPLPGHKDRAVFDIGGVRVGVVGLALAATKAVALPNDFLFALEMDTLKEQARALREEGADLVVACAHTPIDLDYEIARSGLVDVLLTGHDHDLRIEYDGKAAMVESGEEGQFVTAIDLEIAIGERDGQRVVRWHPRFRPIDSAEATPDPAALAIVKRYEAELSRELDVVIAKTMVDLDSRTSSLRSEETNMGDLVADAIRASTGAEIAITNGGGIRADALYPAGSAITRRDILSELPFGNATALVRLSGAEVVKALENGLSQVENRQGRFPQVSGLVVTYDPRQPPGSRVVSVTIEGRPLDKAALYTVGCNDFMLRGGDGYGVLAKGKVLIGGTDGKLLANEVMVYLKRLGTIELRTQGRIVAL